MNRKFLTLAAIMLLVPMMAGAQALKGSYFLDNSLNRNKLNPAFAPDMNYFQIPAIGNLSVGMLSNLDVQSFLFPMNGQLNTFLHKDVTVRQFDRALARNPYMDVAVDLNLINFGWKWGDGFWTVDVGVKADADVDIPSSLFMFMKKGMTEEGIYNLGPVNAHIAASVQAAVGYSRDLSEYVPGLRVGARIRGIIPAAYAGLNFKKVELDARMDKWILRTQGSLHTSVGGFELMGADGAISPSFDPSGIRPAGFGMSIDVGAEYRMEFDGFINSVNFSAAFTDVGFISYGAKTTHAYAAKGRMNWTGAVVSVKDGKFDTAVDELGDFGKLIEFAPEGDKPITRSSLPSFYAGVEMPFLNNMMSVGALYSARASYHYLRNELTLSYNLNPVRWFSLGLNYSFLNVARTMGFVLELTPRIGPCLYLGCDYVPLEWTVGPDAISNMTIPTALRFNFRFGLAFAIGGKR